MKNIFQFLLFCPLIVFGQNVVPFKDFNNYFRSFKDDNFHQIEFQEIREFKAGDELVAYIDTRGNLRVYDGENRIDVTPMTVEYQVSDHLLAYNIGPTLNCWDNGELKTLTYFARNYVVTDSLIVFEDTRYNSVNVYWNNKITQIYQVTGDLYMPTAIGDNIIAFKDNGDFYKIFWQGQIYDLGVWNGNIDFKVGCDILCFNDPTTRTFALFEKGNFLDVEPFFMNKYKAGRGFIAYEDLNGNLIWCKDGKKEQLSNFSASFWEVKDDLLVWKENSFVFAYQDDVKIQVSNYQPEDYLIKNNILVFRNIIGGVSALVNGEIQEITNQSNSEYEIYGDVILVKLFNRSVLVLKNGKIFST
jgi:hypothetical protein